MDKAINFDNMFSFSAEDIIEFLQNTINEEIQKGEKGMDFVLVEECVLMIEQLYGRKIYRPDQNQIDKKYKELQEKYEKVKEDKAFWDNLIGDNEELKSFINETTNKAPQKPVKRIKFRKTLLVAAIILTYILGMTITGVATGNNIFKDKKFFGLDFKELIDGKEITDGKISVIRNDNVSNYDNIDELIKAEKFNGLGYPTDVEISGLNVDKMENETTIYFEFSMGGHLEYLNASTKDQYGLEYNLPTYTKMEAKNGTTVWSYINTNGKYQLMFKVNDWYYCITTSDQEKGIETINNFKFTAATQ